MADGRIAWPISQAFQYYRACLPFLFKLYEVFPLFTRRRIIRLLRCKLTNEDSAQKRPSNLLLHFFLVIFFSWQSFEGISLLNINPKGKYTPDTSKWPWRPTQRNSFPSYCTNRYTCLMGLRQYLGFKYLKVFKFWNYHEGKCFKRQPLTTSS